MKNYRTIAPRFRALKSLQLANHFRRGLVLAALEFPGSTRERVLQDIQQWARQVLDSLEIKVQCNRLPVAGFAGLVVSNHLSWLDILVLQSLIAGTFVAKKEVRSWPIVGRLAQACSTIFVDRSSSRSAREMVERAAEAITNGYAVVAFPEGTSSDGFDVGDFHSNIFESAIRAGTGVQLMTLQYIDARTGKAAGDAHYFGAMTFLSSLWRVLGNSSITACVHIGECIETHGHSRKTLALRAHGKIRNQLMALSLRKMGLSKP